MQTFTDQTIGRNYFSLLELQSCFEKSLSTLPIALPIGNLAADRPRVMCSFVLVDSSGQIQGFRLAYPPGAWSQGKGSKLRSDLWKTPIDQVGYFQSLFLAPLAQGQGWGPKLSDAAVDAFRSLGAKAIVTHAWKESPNNSSIRDLNKFGFQSVATHAHYWIDVDYECVLVQALSMHS